MSTPTTQRPWIVYVRVSTDEQAAHGASLGAQESACRSILGAHGFGPVEVVVDDVSGKNLNRPGIGGVLRRMEAGEITGLCVYAIDRLTRRARDLDDLVDLFDVKRIELISVRERVDTSGPMGRFVLRLIGSIAQLERETIASRVRMGMAHRKAQGGWLARAPAGTVAIRGADGLRRLHADPKTGPIVSRAWAMLVEGRSLMDVATYLNDEKVKTSKGTVWSRTAVAWLVAADSVVGILIDRETWKAAQQALGRRRNKERAVEDRPAPSSRTDREWSLAGLCFCSGCRSAMTVGSGTGRGGRVYAYLRCSGRKRYGREYCAAEDLPYAPLEAAIVEGLGKRAADGSIAEAFGQFLLDRRGAMSTAEGRTPELRAERDRLVKRLALVWEVIEDGGDSGRAARARAGEVQREIDRVEGELAGVEAATAIMARDEAAVARLMVEIPRGLQRLGGAPEGLRREIIAGIVDRIDIDRTEAAVALVAPGVVRFARPSREVQSTGRQANRAKPIVRLRLEWKRVGQGLAATAL